MTKTAAGAAATIDALLFLLSGVVGFLKFGFGFALNVFRLKDGTPVPLDLVGVELLPS